MRKLALFCAKCLHFKLVHPDSLSGNLAGSEERRTKLFKAPSRFSGFYAALHLLDNTRMTLNHAPATRATTPTVCP
jgi:hypothetical protein